jgi:hypothetical protein
VVVGIFLPTVSRVLHPLCRAKLLSPCRRALARAGYSRSGRGARLSGDTGRACPVVLPTKAHAVVRSPARVERVCVRSHASQMTSLLEAYSPEVTALQTMDTISGAGQAGSRPEALGDRGMAAQARI